MFRRGPFGIRIVPAATHPQKTAERIQCVYNDDAIYIACLRFLVYPSSAVAGTKQRGNVQIEADFVVLKRTRMNESKYRVPCVRL
jgi:hypothetical protein